MRTPSGAASLTTLPGFDESVAQAIADALPTLRAQMPRIPLGRAVAIAAPLLARLTAAPGVEWATAGGSLRRGQDTVGDIELVAACENPEHAIDDLTASSDVVRTLHRSARRVYLRMDRAQVGIRFPVPSEAGAALLHVTGARQHVDAIRALAERDGGRLEANGLFAADGTLRAAAREEDIYRALGLPFIPPEIRNGDDEIAAALEGALPDARHARRHSRRSPHALDVERRPRLRSRRWSTPAARLGYEYIAITDHSPTSAASRNLTIDGVKRQAEEIATLREQFADIAILHGCEVDILPDGRLDFPDRVLERLDIVLASLHDRCRSLAGAADAALHVRNAASARQRDHASDQSPGAQPARLRSRLRPALRAGGGNRHRSSRSTARPSHLDLDGALARRAIAAGVTVSIDSDCHRAELLDRQMDLGVMTARRGWVEPRHVLNTRALADVRTAITRKRAS